MKSLKWTLLVAIGMWSILVGSPGLVAQSATVADSAYWRDLLLLPDVTVQIVPEIVAAGVSAFLTESGTATTTVTLSPNHMSFYRTFSPVLGWHCVGSPPQNAILTNTGSQPLKIASIIIYGPFHAANGCGAVLKPHNACTISVASQHVSRGNTTFYGHLAVTDNASGSPQIVFLTLRVGIPC